MRQDDREAKISGQISGYEKKVLDHWTVRLGEGRGEDRTFDIRIRPLSLTHGVHTYAVHLGDATHTIASSWKFGEPLLKAEIDGVYKVIQVDPEGIGYRLFHGGSQAKALVVSAQASACIDIMPVKEPPDTSAFLLSPMPGLLVSLAVEAGQEVKAGEPLATVEAMKMENILRAERDGVIAELFAEPGSSLQVDQKILGFVVD
ncbi:MAG: biotin/lipoyl-containing protein [Rhodospirillaceae bacterium]